MNKYIVRNPQVGPLISSHVKKKDLIERKRLLLNLMATRDAVRVVCAPALFEKPFLLFSMQRSYLLIKVLYG